MLTKYSYLLVAFGGHAQVYITLVCMNACTTGRLIALINTLWCVPCALPRIGWKADEQPML